MSKSGKTSTIFLVVLAVFFVCTTGISVFFFLKEAEIRKGFEMKVGELQGTQAKLQASLQETQKQLQLAEDKKKDAEKQIDNLKNELQVEQDLKAELQKQNSEIKASLDEEKQSKEQLRTQMSKDLSTAEQKAVELQQKLDIVTKQKDEIEARRAELQKQYDEIKARMETMSAQPVSAPSESLTVPPAPDSGEKTSEAPSGSGVPLGTIVVNSDNETSNQSDRGKIITIDKDAEFLIVALGSKDGVTADSVLGVYRGEQHLGDVKVTRVLEDMCAVDFVPPLNSQAVNKDDRVVLMKQ